MMTLAKEYPIQRVCQTLGYPRSAYYHQRKPVDDRPLPAALRQVAEEWPTYGDRRLTAPLRREGQTVNSKRVRRGMGAVGLLRPASGKRPRTTDSAPAFPRFPNRGLNLSVERPGQVWGADIAYVHLRCEFVDLAVRRDVFTRCIRGWHLRRQRNLDGERTLRAWQRATAGGRQPEMPHSDRGVQYAATENVERLRAAGVRLSMARVGEPRENGYAERLIRTIKEEEVELSEYADYHDAYRQMGRFLDEVDTHKRIHSSLGYLTPAEFESQWLREQRGKAVVH
jgi:transposase InsO family protein